MKEVSHKKGQKVRKFQKFKPSLGLDLIDSQSSSVYNQDKISNEKKEAAKIEEIIENSGDMISIITWFVWKFMFH